MKSSGMGNGSRQVTRKQRRRNFMQNCWVIAKRKVIKAVGPITRIGKNLA